MNKTLAYKIASFYFFYFAIIAVHIIFMPKVLSQVGYSPSQIGIIFASAPLVRFIIPFLFLRGLKLNKNIFNMALILLVTSAMSFYFAIENFYAIVSVNILLGIGLSLILPYIEVIALEKIGKEDYGKIRLFGSIGFVLVSLVLVRFTLTPENSTLYLSTMAIISALFGYLITKDEKEHKSDALHVELNVKGIRSHWSLWLGMLFMQVSFGAYYNFFTIYETDRGVSLDMTIYLWSFGVLVEIVMLYFQGPLLKRELKMLLIFAAFMTTLRWVIVDMYATNIVVLFISQSIHAISFALFHTVSIAYLYTLYSQKKLAQQFFFGICYGLGGFLGALISGYIYEYFSDYLFMSSAFFSLLATLFFVHASKFINKRS